MISVLLLLVLLAWPVVAWKLNGRLNKPFAADLVCLGILMIGVLILIATRYTIYAEFGPSLTDSIVRERNGNLENSELSPAALSARSLSTFTDFLVAPFAILWYLAVCYIEYTPSTPGRLAGSTKEHAAQCPQCDNRISYQSALTGLDGKCPQCDTTFTFP